MGEGDEGGRGGGGEWDRREERGKSTQSDDFTHLSVETNRELVSGVCRLSELLVSPGYREEEEGGREREGGILPPPVAIHYNYREWLRERTPGCNKRQWNQTRNCHEPKKLGSCLCRLTTQRMCVGRSLYKTKRAEATTDDSCYTHLDNHLQSDWAIY